MRKPRQVFNFTDMGRNPHPFLPSAVIMTDRADGTEWLLSWSNHEFDGSQGLHFTAKMRFTLNSTIPKNLRKDLMSFGPLDGPYFYARGHLLRLLVRSTRLGYEVATDLGVAVQALTQPRIFGKSGFEPTVLEVIMPSSWVRSGDTLSWEENDLD